LPLFEIKSLDLGADSFYGTTLEKETKLMFIYFISPLNKSHIEKGLNYKNTILLKLIFCIWFLSHFKDMENAKTREISLRNWFNLFYKMIKKRMKEKIGH
jgi:hypothetical protein